MGEKVLKNKYFKKICASVLIISLIFGLVPNTVGAEESTQNFTKELNDTTPEIITTTDGIQEGLELQEEPKVLGELESEREENVKHFLMSDRTVRAVMYSEPVHYYEDEEWKEIDPTLTLEEANDQDDFIGYINKKGNVTIKIAEKDTEKSLVKIQKDKYKIKFKFMKDQKEGYIEPKIAVVKEEETLNGLTSNSNSRNESSFQVDTVSDSIVYEGITDNETTDIEYKVTSTGLKENIIVRAKQDSYEYIFDIQTDYLELELKDNEIKAFDPQTGKVIYVIPAPFMYDANHKMSTDVIYSLEKNSTGYQLVVTGDKEWINAEDTVFPVTIDPVITTETTKEAISSTFVSSGMPSTNFFDYKMLLVGLETSSYNKTRTLIKIQLPELGQGDIVQSAYLNLLQYDISSFTTSNPDMPINAYEVTSSWNESTVTWNTMPSYDSRKLDYNYISRTDGIETKTFDITKAAKEWYDGDTSNFGIILRADKETGDYAEVAMNARYWSEKYNEETDAYPIIILEYRNSKGMEDYYSYTDLDAGSAGNAYINNYTGNLYFAQAGVVTGGLKMPASVYLTYNTSALNDDSANLKLKSGYGWKLNVQQYVISSSNRGLSSEAQQTYPYVYVDGDGTDHYFMKVVNGTTTTYIDEDGLGLELSKDTSTGYYTIRDKNDTVMTFRDNGNLISVIDSNGNTITVNYDTSGTLIQSVTDGAGKQISINYTNEYLSSIIDPAGRAINYTIDVGGSTETIDDKLTKVTYPDSTLINYTYDEDNTLSNIKSSDGYELDFTYLPKAAGKRISKVTEHAYHTDGTKETGQSIGFDYSKHNTTIIKTSGQDNQYGTADDLNTVYQFDNYGRLISTQANVNGKQLGTSLTKYTSGQADVTGSNIKQLNRVSSSISYGANVNNLLKNHNVESSDIWQLIKTGTANEVAGYTSVEKYIGNQSLKISVTGAASGSNVRYRQMLTNDVVKPGNTYTFSGYIKTTELNPLVKDSFGAALLVYSYFADGSVKAFYSDNISSTNDEEINDGWRRESVTFTVPAGTVETSVNLVLRNANGNAYFDSLQLEEGSTANSYNLLENASFENETNLYGYTSTDLTLGTTVDMPVQDSIDGNWGFRVVGDAQKSKKLSQEVNVSGSEEDTYIVSGWAKAFAVPELIQNDIESKYRKFKISVKVTYSDGTSLWKSTAEFNPSVLDWQYSAVTINLSDNDSATNKTPSKISIYLRYEYQANEVIFDNLSIIKDSVPSYTYDLDGNLISVTDNAKQKSSMTYSNQNLISSTDAKGYDYQYTYDTKHNMTQAKSQRGVTYNYTYHSSGNPTKLVIQNMESSAYDWKIQTDMTYTPDGAYVNTVSDQDGYVTTTSYDADKGLLDSVTDAKGNTIQYTYDNDNDSLTQVSGTVGGQEVANSYEYNKKLLSRITHNGFSYNLLYDVFGNSTNVKVGNVSLITYGYKAGNGDLDIITYGNGDTNTYQYDIYGNVSELAVDGNVRYKWSADNAGNVIKHEDLRNALIYNYEYDTTGRLIRQSVMDTTKSVTSQRNVYLLEYGYDLNNNITKFVTKAGSRTLTNSYEYTKDNLPTKYTMPTGKTVTYSYDSLNRMNQYITSTTAPITVGYTYVLSKRNEVGQNNYRTTKIEAETVGNLGTKYSYDELGNIT
jgi:YD repeat-containing protein